AVDGGLDVTDSAGRPSLLEVRRDLRADCSRCAGLCCVAPAFAQSADFAISKPAGLACPNLGSDFGCNIHGTLRERGFPGCAVFDCFGAGQQVVQGTFAGRDWLEAPETAASMFDVFGVMRQLKELLWYLAEALAHLPSGPLQEQVEQVQQRTRRLVEGSAHELERLDPRTLRAQVGPLLGEVSETLRADVPGRGPDRPGADLIGADLEGADLRGVSLRGAYLIGADLSAANLGRTDVLGADVRGADLSGASLEDALFLTQPQLEAARGDRATSIPPWLDRPRRWSVSAAPPRSARPHKGRGRARRRSGD
ncbi:MAG: hypothetical protein QOJ32_2388, partial [Frankiaceae bacterium]|nr:hypothetical protein [Frankiaceae bacterium]